MDKLLIQIFVLGKVQGVWFRKYTIDKANSLSINGFVRNELDGSVYIEAEGHRDQLDLLVEWLSQGSPLSRITSVKYNVIPLKNYNSFEIRD